MRTKSFFIVLSLLALVSCQCEEMEYVSDSPARGKEITITASFGDSDLSTRTSISSNGKVLWSPGEAINIFYGPSGESSGSKFVSQNTEATSTAVFTGTITAFTGVSEGGEPLSFWGIYPYSESNRCDGSSVVLELPVVQNAVEENFEDNTVPMVAQAPGLALPFYNVCSMIRFSLVNSDITKVTVRGNNGETVAGRVSVSMGSDGKPVWSDTAGEGSKSVTLNAPSGGTFEAGKFYYIAILPGEFPNGYTMEFFTSDDRYGKRVRGSSITFDRNAVTKQSNRDEGVTWTDVVDYEAEPFTITSIGSTSVSIFKERYPGAITLEYKKGSGTWAAYTISSPIELSDGESLQFRAGESGNQSFSQEGSYASTLQHYYYVGVDGEGTINVSGNIMSLVDRTMQRTDLEPYMFHGLFYHCTKLVDASNFILPSTTLAYNCYTEMFGGCISLTSAPKLPATSLNSMCYYGMFDSCFSLTEAPELPATTLAHGCYWAMFYDCRSLTEAPLLPATTLASSCYDNMFSGCSNLRYVKAYYTTYLSGDSWSTGNWLSNVSSTGTFVKHSAAKWDVRGSSGIPEGWNIEYDDVDLGLPTIGEVVVEDVAYKTVTVLSSLTSDSHEIKKYGFYYGTSADAITTLINASDLNAGVFSTEITGLIPGTTYYIKAYAKNEAGTVESDVVSFTTTATSGTLNGYEWVDIGIRKSMYNSSIEPGSSRDRRIVFATQNIGASSQYGTGYFFRGNELYGWQYSGSTSSYTSITSTNLAMVDNEGNTIRTFSSDDFYWSDENPDFIINYTTGDAVNYYYGSGWKFMPEQLIKKLYCNAGSKPEYPSTVSKTVTSFTGLTLTFEFTSSYLRMYNSNLGTSVIFPYGGRIEGWCPPGYYPGEGNYWAEGDIKEIYCGGIKPGWCIYNDSGSWVASGYFDGIDVYTGCHIRAVAELPL